MAENRSLLRECQEIENGICEARQAFVAEILVDERGFFGLDVVEDGELRGWRADGVLQGQGHDDLCSDAWGEVMDIDVAECFENLFAFFGKGIEMPHVGLQLGVGVFAQVHVPDAAVVGEEGVKRNAAFDAGFERSAGDGERAALRSAIRCEAVGIHFVKRGHDASELDGVEKDAAEEKFFRSIGEAANDVPVVGVAGCATWILTLPALATAVHGCDRDAFAGEAEFIGPFTTVASVAVEFQNRWMWIGDILGTDIFRVDSRPADAGECEVENLAVARLKRIGAFQLGLRIDGIQLCKRAAPVVVKIGRSWVSACVGLELSEWVVEAGHGVF